MSNPSQLVLDASVYSLDAVKRAVYDLASEAAIQISMQGSSIVLQFESGREIALYNICEKILDHQLRAEAEEQYAVIRNILVAQAVHPRSDLEDVLKVIFDEQDDYL